MKKNTILKSIAVPAVVAGVILTASEFLENQTTLTVDNKDISKASDEKDNKYVSLPKDEDDSSSIREPTVDKPVNNSLSDPVNEVVDNPVRDQVEVVDVPVTTINNQASSVRLESQPVTKLVTTVSTSRGNTNKPVETRTQVIVKAVPKSIIQVSHLLNNLLKLQLKLLRHLLNNPLKHMRLQLRHQSNNPLKHLKLLLNNQ